jgi:hypothetical protein
MEIFVVVVEVIFVERRPKAAGLSVLSWRYATAAIVS